MGMKTPIKCTVFSLLTAIVLSAFTGGAASQSKLEDIRYNFTGEKTRIVFDLAAPAAFMITEDWLDNAILIDLPHVAASDLSRYSTEKWRNYIIKEAGLNRSGKGIRLKLKTRTDFRIKFLSLTKGNRLVFDIYPLLESPGPETLLRRARTYENRRKYEKAVVLYRRLLSQNHDDETAYHLGLSLKMADSPGEARTVLRSIPEESPYYGRSCTLLKELEAADRESDQHHTDSDEKPDNPESITGNDTPVLNSAALQLPDAETDGDATREAQDDTYSINGVPPADESSGEGSTRANMLPGLQDLLKKTGTEHYVLYVLYGAIGILLLIVSLLTRRIIRMYRPSRSRKSRNARNRFPDNPPVHLLHKKRTSGGKQKQMQEIRNFAQKLSELYKKTEAAAPKQKPAASRVTETEEEHNRLIEQLFTDADPMPFDSESINLIKKFNDSDAESGSLIDKYEAVRQLAEKNWEVWEIARELSIGAEEVKMLLARDVRSERENSGKALYNDIYRLSDAHLSPAEIAGKLHIGEEEVRLALKWRKRDDTVVQEMQQ